MAAVTAFWLASGHALCRGNDTQQQSSRISAPIVAMETPAVVVPDPVVTSSVPEKTTGVSVDGYTAPLPRPAPIERAGSILMIRPAGD